MNSNSFQETEVEVSNYLSDLIAVLSDSNCKLDILPKKSHESPIDPKTTENTMRKLEYDDEDVRTELLSLTKAEYMETMLDDKDPTLPPFRVFGKQIQGSDVYIKVKIRDKINKKVFCVSFHFARSPFKGFPYK